MIPACVPVAPSASGLPAMNALVSMDFVVASSEPTLTTAPRPNSTPLAFWISTWPLASSEPWMLEGRPPVTRFSACAWALGWLNRTVLSLPMLKVFQSITARWLPWSMCIVLPLGWEMVAWPATTLPLVGSACA